MSGTEPHTKRLQKLPAGRPRANELDGRTWGRYSISIWSDIRKLPEELRLGHPAVFPVALAERIIRCFASEADRVVLDPFAGCGSTLLAAQALGKVGIGIDIAPEYCELARSRPLPGQAVSGDGRLGERIVYQGDARDLLRFVAPASVDLVVTSPPYWDVLGRPRTADFKPIRDYAGAGGDLGHIADYGEFLAGLGQAFREVLRALKPGKYCVVVVMDIRKKERFYPLHADLARVMEGVGFIFDDIIIWDRRHEYNHLRPLGYPYRFRVNKVHEYILIFRTPEGPPRT